MNLGDIYSFPLLKGEAFASYQVVGFADESARKKTPEVVVHRQVYDKRPTAGDIDINTLMVLDHHAFKSSFEHLYVSTQRPSNHEFVAHIDARPALKKCVTYGSYESLQTAVERQLEWNRLPEEARALHDDAKRNPQQVITLTFDAKSYQLSRRSSWVHLEYIERGDFNQLAPLGMIYNLYVEGPCIGLEDYLRRQPIIYALEWSNAGRDVDFSDSGIKELVWRDEQSRTLTFNRRLDKLDAHSAITLSGSTLVDEVHFRQKGSCKNALYEKAAIENGPSLKDISRNIKRLRIHGDRHDIYELEHFTQLKTIEWHDAFHLKAKDWPAISVDEIEFSGVLKDTFLALKEMNAAPRMRARHKKDQAWVDGHIDNPFLEWDSKKKKRAVTAFKKLRKASAKESVDFSVLEALNPPAHLLEKARSMCEADKK